MDLTNLALIVRPFIKSKNAAHLVRISAPCWKYTRQLQAFWNSSSCGTDPVEDQAINEESNCIEQRQEAQPSHEPKVGQKMPERVALVWLLQLIIGLPDPEAASMKAGLMGQIQLTAPRDHQTGAAGAKKTTTRTAEQWSTQHLAHRSGKSKRGSTPPEIRLRG